MNDYTSDGRKLSSRHKTSIPKVNGYTLKTTTDLYVDGLILRGGKPLMWQFDGGFVALNDNGTPTSWNYYVTDHLGSTRMVVSNDSIKETINYYPFGSEMKMENPALLTGGISHPFRFTGKELDRLSALNMYDFGARWYSVDLKGNTTSVISKMGQEGISINHPRAPGFYDNYKGYSTGSWGQALDPLPTICGNVLRYICKRE